MHGIIKRLFNMVSHYNIEFIIEQIPTKERCKINCKCPWCNGELINLSVVTGWWSGKATAAIERISYSYIINPRHFILNFISIVYLTPKRVYSWPEVVRGRPQSAGSIPRQWICAPHRRHRVLRLILFKLLSWQQMQLPFPISSASSLETTSDALPFLWHIEI